MIFFESDWDYYPTAIPHVTTKNKSWLEYADLLKRMGVGNYYSHLALIDPSLEYVDPHDANITKEVAERVLLECQSNIWYFLREVVRVPAQASPHPSMLRAERGNMALYFLAMNDIDVGITQIRQTGKTLNCNILLAYCLTIACMNTTIYLMTRNDKLRAENVAAIKEIIKLLPSYIAQRTRDDSDNKDTVTCVAMGNKILTQLPQNSEEDAKGAGRGFTSSIIMIDESAFCKNIQHSYPAMMASSNAAVDEAKASGLPNFKLLPCTAGDKGSAAGAFMYKVYHNVAKWKEHLLDSKDKNDLQEIVRTNSRNRRLMCYIEMNHRQLGRTDAWLYEKIIESEGKGDDVNRDFFNQWTSGSGESPLDRLIREAINKSKRTPLWVETNIDNYQLNWYISKQEVSDRIQKDVKFVAGLDSSEGLGRDQMTLVLIDEQTLETIAALSVSDVVSTIRFSDFICKTMIKYPNMVLIPERRSTGIVIIDSLLIQLPAMGMDPFTRIFNTAIHEDKQTEAVRKLLTTPFNRRPTNAYEVHKGLFGYATAGNGIYSRNNLYELTLPRLSNYAAENVRDSNLISELMSLVIKRGRIDHGASGHDDHVIAWLLAGWFLNFGKNLSNYGITNPMLKVLSYKERSQTVTETKTQKFDRMQQQLLKDNLSNLIKRLSLAESDMDAVLIEKKIRYLRDRITHDTKLPLSIDELVKEANLIRKNKAQNARRGMSPAFRRAG